MATRRLSLHPDADKDLSEGLSFYLQHSRVAAERFLDEVESAFERIRNRPESSAFYRLGMRRYVIPRFPYSIVFRATLREIQVFAVAHAKRRPAYWRKRRFGTRQK